MHFFNAYPPTHTILSDDECFIRDSDDWNNSSVESIIKNNYQKFPRPITDFRDSNFGPSYNNKDEYIKGWFKQYDATFFQQFVGKARITVDTYVYINCIIFKITTKP